MGFFLEKAGLFTKFVDTFFQFVGKRASWCLMQKTGTDEKKKMNERIISDTAVFSGEKGVSIET